MKLALQACFAALIAGCAAQPQAPFHAVESERALLRWKQKRATFVFEAIFARSGEGGVLVSLYKHSPAPLLEFRLDADDRFTARGTLAGRGWSGPRGEIPPQLSPWPALLDLYRRSDKLPRGEQEIHTAASRVAYSKDTRLRTISIMSADTGDIISATLK